MMIVESNKDNIYLLSRRWEHHSNHSGYDLLGQYIGKTLNSNPIPKKFLPDSIFRRMTQNMTGYDRVGVALELMAVKHMATHNNGLYHILYGETCYNYLGLFNEWRDNRVIATFHHPPQKLAIMVRKKEVIKRLSAVIIVGSNQHSFFTGLLPNKRIFLIPHPVDTSYYMPPQEFSQRGGELCLFVGSHLRDFATLRVLIEDARILFPKIRFVIVTRQEEFAEFDGVVGNFTLLCGIPESDLLKLYQEATILIQPILDSTANNSILEGMSCGMPMVVTDIGAVREYVNDDCAVVVPPYNVDAMLDAISHLLSDINERKRMATNARKRAMMFDWKLMAQRYNNIYKEILFEN